MPNITMRELLEAGVHFGHQTNHWNPKMKKYVFGARNGIYIIDLQKTVEQAKSAAQFVTSVAAEGKKVLFVGTKKQAKDVVENEAKRADMYYVTNRWLGGMLTNYQTVKASIDRLKKIDALKNSPEWNEHTKKEQSKLDKELEKLKKSLGGIQEMRKLPGALFIIDTMKEHIAIKEAKKLGIPTIAVVDTNCNPEDVDYVIPGNDDAIRSITLFAKIVADSCLEGAKVYQERARAQKVDLSDEEAQEKKVSRFEGDIDLKGIDEADLEEMEVKEEVDKLTAEAKARGLVVAEDEVEKLKKADFSKEKKEE